MTIEFLVIGELKNDPGHFLLRGDDGQCYAYDVAMDVIVPIEVDGNWAVDTITEDPGLIEENTHRVVSGSTEDSSNLCAVVGTGLMPGRFDGIHDQ